MNDIIWEEPPADALIRSRRTAYTEFADQLRENPGKWAVLPSTKEEDRTEKGAKGTVANLRAGKMKDFPKGEFEATSSGAKIYVRYVEPEGEGGTVSQLSQHGERGERIEETQ